MGGLGEEGTRLELEVAFEEIGPVKNIWLAKNPPSFAFIEMEVRDLQEMQSIIEYYQVLSSIFKYDRVFSSMIIKQTLLQDPRDAEDAVKALDGTELCGMIAHVEMAKVVFIFYF